MFMYYRDVIHAMLNLKYQTLYVNGMQVLHGEGRKMMFVFDNKICGQTTGSNLNVASPCNGDFIL